MVALWIPVTVAAAFLQNLRSAQQKALKGRLSTAGAAYARFIYALPFACLYLWGLTAFGGYETPTPNLAFFLWCAAGGLAQILFTVTLLWLFSFRSFAVGTTFSKLEVLVVAGLGAVLLGDGLSLIGWAAVALGAAGCGALSFTETKLTPGALIRGMREKSTAVGLLAALLLGASSTAFRGAALALDGPDFVVAAAYALAIALAMQTAMMGGWFLWRDRGELARVFREWRRAGPVGLTGMACSVCWFTAFTLQNAAYVRAVGQIELVFTFLAGWLVFGERTRTSEVVGVLMIVGAIIVLLIAA